jgi:Protein of unknown function (DUF3703)
MSYEEELSAGETELKAGRFAAARLHFGRAHGLGHEVRCRHIMAHRGLLDVAVRTRNVREAFSQAFLIGATYAFDRPADRQRRG